MTAHMGLHQPARYDMTRKRTPLGLMAFILAGASVAMVAQAQEFPKPKEPLVINVIDVAGRFVFS